MSEIIYFKKFFSEEKELGCFTNGTFIFKKTAQINSLDDAKQVTRFSRIRGDKTYSYYDFWHRVNNLLIKNAEEQLWMLMKTATLEQSKRLHFIDCFVFLGE